jgi:hypothetical protein
MGDVWLRVAPSRLIWAPGSPPAEDAFTRAGGSLRERLCLKKPARTQVKEPAESRLQP